MVTWAGEVEVSRNQGDFIEVGNERLGGTELLALIREQGTLPVRDLQQAIACYLSSGEGWEQALKVLRGTFAKEAGQPAASSKFTPDKHEINQHASEYLQRPGLKPVGNDND
jgi:hypothetical protein